MPRWAGRQDLVEEFDDFDVGPQSDEFIPDHIDDGDLWDDDLDSDTIVDEDEADDVEGDSYRSMALLDDEDEDEPSDGIDWDAFDFDED